MNDGLWGGGKATALLNAATATGAGSTVRTNGFRTYSIQVISTGSPDAVKVNVEGSNDGATWFVIGAWDSSTPQTSGDIVVIKDSPCLYIRPNLATLTNGTAPTVTAYITAV